MNINSTRSTSLALNTCPPRNARSTNCVGNNEMKKKIYGHNSLSIRVDTTQFDEPSLSDRKDHSYKVLSTSIKSMEKAKLAAPDGKDRFVPSFENIVAELQKTIEGNRDNEFKSKDVTETLDSSHTPTQSNGFGRDAQELPMSKTQTPQRRHRRSNNVDFSTILASLGQDDIASSPKAKNPRRSRHRRSNNADFAGIFEHLDEDVSLCSKKSPTGRPSHRRSNQSDFTSVLAKIQE